MPKTTLTESKRPRAGETAIARIAPPGQGTVEYFDNDYPGLALRVSKSGRRSWTHLYRFDGKLQRRNLGIYPATTLQAARDAWTDDRRSLRDGVDPEAARREKMDAAAAERARAATFADAVSAYHRRYLSGEAATKSADDVRDALLKECADWTSRRVDSIGAAEIGALVENIRDGGRPIWANRVYAFLRHFYSWCSRPEVGYVDRHPMEGMRRPTKNEEPRDRWFDADEIAALWHAAPELGIYEGAYLRVLLLLGKRKNALAAMRWDEIGNDGWWRPTDAALPPAKKLHQPIPLPASALKILRGVPRMDDNPFVFVGRRRGGHLDPGTPLQRRVQSASGVEDFYWHAARHTVGTHLSKLRVPGNAARRFTDHAQVSDAHERVYTHDDLEAATEDAAEAWGRFVSLVTHRRIWAKVSAYLDAADVREGEERRRAYRDRQREFCGLIQTGGEPWVRWARSIARPTASGENVVQLRAGV